MILFKLKHIELQNDKRNEIKNIGYFSDMRSVNITIEIYKKLPGFCDCLDGFLVSKVYIEKYAEKTIYESILYLHDSSYSIEYSETIGIYENKDLAEKSIEKYKNINYQFIKKCNLDLETIVNKHILDVPSNWKEGYID